MPAVLNLPPLPDWAALKGLTLPAPEARPQEALPPVDLHHVPGMPFLPPIGRHLDSVPPSHTDVTNPGDSMPQRQQFGRHGADQSTGVSHFPGTGAPSNSDGQQQRRDLNPGQQGVTVTAGASSAVHSSDGQRQMRDMRPIDQGTSSSGAPSLPVNVNADSQSFVRSARVEAETSPIAVDVDGGKRRPGGLPRSVMVR